VRGRLRGIVQSTSDQLTVFVIKQNFCEADRVWLRGEPCEAVDSIDEQGLL